MNYLENQNKKDSVNCILNNSF